MTMYETAKEAEEAHKITYHFKLYACCILLSQIRRGSFSQCVLPRSNHYSNVYSRAIITIPMCTPAL